MFSSRTQHKKTVCIYNNFGLVYTLLHFSWLKKSLLEKYAKFYYLFGLPVMSSDSFFVITCHVVN